jgi:uncharacterized protein RhaS with RHS repeats
MYINNIENISSGIFTSRDPIGLGGGDKNLYRYVGNRPLSSLDPYGLSCQSFVAGIATPNQQYIGGIIVGVIGAGGGAYSVYLFMGTIATGGAVLPLAAATVIAGSLVYEGYINATYGMQQGADGLSSILNSFIPNANGSENVPDLYGGGPMDDPTYFQDSSANSDATFA